MGLRYVQGLGTRERAALEAVPSPCRDLEQFVRMSRLPERSLKKLAEAGAFESFGVARREKVTAGEEEEHHHGMRFANWTDATLRALLPPTLQWVDSVRTREMEDGDTLWVLLRQVDAG